MASDVMRFFAAWMLTHDTADEGLRAAIARGRAQGAQGMEGGPDAFVDGLAAMVADEMDRLKAELASGAVAEKPDVEDVKLAVDELRFEVGELRGRLDRIDTAIEAVLAKLDGGAA